MLKADVSELSVGSIFIGRSMKCDLLHRPTYEDGTDRVPKCRLLALGRRGDTQKKTHYKFENDY